MSFNIILTFRVNCKNSLWNLVVIFNFRGGSTFYFRPILHSFPSELRSLQRTKTILRDRVPFYQEKEAVFEVILSTCSEFSQIGTPHFSLEGVNFIVIVSSTSILAVRSHPGTQATQGINILNLFFTFPRSNSKGTLLFYFFKSSNSFCCIGNGALPGVPRISE